MGTWEGVWGIGRIPIVFHVQIAPRDEDSYLAEIYPEHLNGRVYRLQTCTITGAKVYLRFVALPGGDGSEWWIEGEGYGMRKKAWLYGRVGTGHNARDVGDVNFYFAKGRTSGTQLRGCLRNVRGKRRFRRRRLPTNDLTMRWS